jgi:hypothetical protein
MSSQPPMIGSWSVLVHAVRPFSIHGDLYYELHVTRLDEDQSQGLAIRVPQHAVGSQPNVGDRLSLTFLMGQVTGAKRLP